MRIVVGFCKMVVLPIGCAIPFLVYNYNKKNSQAVYSLPAKAVFYQPFRHCPASTWYQIPRLEYSESLTSSHPPK